HGENPMSDASSYPACFDPYLRYAIAHNFINVEFFDEANGFELFFLVEFMQADQASKFETPLNDLKYEAVLRPLAEAYKPRSRTMRPSKSVVIEQAALDLWIKYVSRVELSLPLKPNPLLPFQRINVIDRSGDGKNPTSELLIGILDDGCPFASAQFLQGSSQA